MRTKFVVRFLDADDALVGWAEVWADPHEHPRGASCPFWPTSSTSFVAEMDATIVKMSVHWCDLDVARVRDLEPFTVTAGVVAMFVWIEPVWLVPGMRDVPLPATTIRQSVTLEAKPGVLGVVGCR